MPKRRAGAKAFFRSAGDFFWSLRSLISGERGLGHGPLPPEDVARLHFISDPICDRCGVPLDFRTGDETWCVVCLARPPRWDRPRAARVQDKIARRPVLDLKRAGRRDGLATLCGWMRQAGGVLIDEADVLAPVPLQHTRLIVRGFNQSGWLAQAIGAETGRKVLVDVVGAHAAHPQPGRSGGPRAAAERGWRVQGEGQPAGRHRGQAGAAGGRCANHRSNAFGLHTRPETGGGAAR